MINLMFHRAKSTLFYVPTPREQCGTAHLAVTHQGNSVAYPHLAVQYRGIFKVTVRIVIIKVTVRIVIIKVTVTIVILK